jgi:hypothetical protein
VDAHDFVLSWVNDWRLSVGVQAFVLDSCLNDVAQTGSEETVATGVVQAKWERECRPIIPECTCNWQAENQDILARTGDWWDYDLGVILQSMIANEASEAHGNIFSSTFSRLGVGVACNLNTVLTLDFAP